MPVNASQTAIRVLEVFELIADKQPIGVRAVSKALGKDKSAVHRAIRALIAQGWVVSTEEPLARFRISSRFLTLANTATAGFDLRHRSRAILERLRDRCQETVALMVLNGSRLIVADVFEGRNALRWFPPVGTQAEPHRTAGGRAIIAFLPPSRQTEVLGGAVDPQLECLYQTVRNRGFSVSDRETSEFAASVGAPVFDADGLPHAAVTIIGPSERINQSGWDNLGRLAISSANRLSS
jgi:IclR family acetate operon transcriptional repressor